MISTLSLHHWRDPVAALNEIARVLRPGGSFLIFDLRRDLAMPVWLLLCLPLVLGYAACLAPDQRADGQPGRRLHPARGSRTGRQSRLSGWRITAGPLWLIIEGTV